MRTPGTQAARVPLEGCLLGAELTWDSSSEGRGPAAGTEQWCLVKRSQRAPSLSTPGVVAWGHSMGRPHQDSSV